MKGFKFRLESILNIKDKLEQQAKIAYGVEVSNLNNEKKKLEDLYVSKEENTQKQRENFTGTIDIFSFNQYRNYGTKLDEMIVNQIQAVKAQEIKVEEAREILAEIVKERKALEKLKEKELEQFKKDVQLSEDKLVDELVTYKFGTR